MTNPGVLIEFSPAVQPAGARLVSVKLARMSRVPEKKSASNSLRGLYVITDERMGGHGDVAQAAVRGGAAVVQLRDKSTPDRELLRVAKEIRQLTRDNQVVFIVNDRLDLALLCEADGVHLGPDDWPVKDVRHVVGPDFLIGASCGTPEEARAAQMEGASYIGVGAVFGTATKLDAGAAIGLDGLRAVMAATDLPIAAIGGVNAGNLHLLLEAGADMICVVSAVAAAGEVTAMEEAARELCRKIQLND